MKKVSKLDAACSQLETAVVLYFQDGDPVSIHTLTSAAYGILCGINDATAGEPMLEDSLRAVVAHDFAPKLHGYLNEAQNFFKHADRDADKTLDFNPRHTDLVLHFACMTYKRLAGENRPVLLTFESWAMLTFARVYMTTPVDVIRLPGGSEVASMTRSEFFREALPLARRATLGARA